MYASGLSAIVSSKSPSRVWDHDKGVAWRNGREKCFPDEGSWICPPGKSMILHPSAPPNIWLLPPSQPTSNQHHHHTQTNMCKLFMILNGVICGGFGGMLCFMQNALFSFIMLIQKCHHAKPYQQSDTDCSKHADVVIWAMFNCDAIQFRLLLIRLN